MTTIIRNAPPASWAAATFAVFYLSLGVTWATAVVSTLVGGDWRGDWAWDAADYLARGVFFVWVGYIAYDNARLRRHPMWAQVDKAWHDGYFAATRANGVVR